MIRRLLPLLLAFVLALPLTAHARTLYVNGGGGGGDGSSWNAPLKGLNEALAAAASGDQIWVAAGVYMPTAGNDRDATFALKPGVTVYGGFEGTETELKRRDVKKHQTILSGDIGVPGDMDDNVYHVVTGADKGVLDGFTITGGYSRNVPWEGGNTFSTASLAAAAPRGAGAGMLNFGTAPEVRNCLFQDNHALMGGAVYNAAKQSANGVPAASPRFIECIFWQNSAAGYGGGAANSLRTHALYVSCEFDSNLSDYQGGGMYNTVGAAPSLLNTIFRNNEAPLGGGMANDGAANPSVYYCTFTGNRALKQGPAIHQGTSGPNVTVLIKTVVWDNECEGGDTRFFSAPGSEVRAQETVIQGGFKGKLIFQANPGLDRKSETLLNTGYKSNGYRFRGDKLDARLRDIARFEVSANPPGFDPAVTVAVAPEVLRAKPAAPMTASVPMPEPQTAVPPVLPVEPEAAPQAAVPAAPQAKAAPEPAPEPLVEPEPKAESLALLEPQTSLPEKRPTGGSPEAMLLQFDLDGNGCITVNEAQGTLQQQFWRVDHNSDGCISRTELQRMQAKNGKSIQPEPQARAAAPQPTPKAAPKPAPKAAPKPAPAAPRETVALATPQAPPARTAPPAKPAPARPSGPVQGYTLFAPVGGTETFLVDMQGKVVKKWANKDASTGAVYLLNNGNLLRTVSPAQGEIRTPFEGEDVHGGIIQEISPRGQIVWEYSYISKDVRQHHDIAPLPNGNVLLLAWEMKYESEIEAAGGAIRAHPDGRIWAEHIVEVRKSGPRSGYIVWEWHSWDHLIQNADEDAPNYASPVRLPQRIDLNYNPTRRADWHHATSIDFNPALNQILLSVRNLNEVWIIDHSTTTTQAATNSGGLMRRGGDLLFRWGNPAAFGAAGPSMLSSQYDAQWVDNGQPGQESILIFNNGNRRTQRSDVIEIKPQYYLRSTRLDADVVWSYSRQAGENFFADQYSGAQRLANGNTLIADSAKPRIVEVSPSGDAVWEYRPEGAAKRLFRATRIPLGHPGLKRLSIQ